MHKQPASTRAKLPATLCLAYPGYSLFFIDIVVSVCRFSLSYQQLALSFSVYAIVLRLPNTPKFQLKYVRT